MGLFVNGVRFPIKAIIPHGRGLIYRTLVRWNQGFNSPEIVEQLDGFGLTVQTARSRLHDRLREGVQLQYIVGPAGFD